MNYDYSKLRGKIREVTGTQDKFANQIGLGRVSLSQRLTGKLEFSQQEMQKACEILEIDIKDIPNYFFNLKVHKNEHERKE